LLKFLIAVHQFLNIVDAGPLGLISILAAPDPIQWVVGVRDGMAMRVRKYLGCICPL
jgi:hypothetical protein